MDAVFLLLFSISFFFSLDHKHVRVYAYHAVTLASWICSYNQGAWCQKEELCHLGATGILRIGVFQRGFHAPSITNYSSSPPPPPFPPFHLQVSAAYHFWCWKKLPAIDTFLKRLRFPNEIKGLGLGDP